ncbi:hypothetical protein ACXYX3_11355 [Mycobacterium sp. C3-094]
MALTFDDDQASALLEALGLPTDTTDVETIAATVRDAATASTAETAQPSAVAAAARRVGLGVMDNDSLEALKRDAAEGRRIKAAEAKQRIEASVDDAISKGKITPGRKKHWVTLIEADPEMANVLASTPNETAVPLSEIGHGLGSDEPHDKAVDGQWFY